MVRLSRSLWMALGMGFHDTEKKRAKTATTSLSSNRAAAKRAKKARRKNR